MKPARSQTRAVKFAPEGDVRETPNGYVQVVVNGEVVETHAGTPTSLRFKPGEVLTEAEHRRQRAAEKPPRVVTVRERLVAELYDNYGQCDRARTQAMVDRIVTVVERHAAQIDVAGLLATHRPVLDEFGEPDGCDGCATAVWDWRMAGVHQREVLAAAGLVAPPKVSTACTGCGHDVDRHRDGHGCVDGWSAAEMAARVPRCPCSGYVESAAAR